MRILLAGVPFGCDNVGDEAILECALAIFRRAAPEAEITVSTGDAERTAARLGVATCGLLGFFGEVSPEETQEIIGAHDCFVWCGATGLSDYPQVTTRLMLLAQSMGKKTILWGVGMNDELTPSFHKVLPGRRRKVLAFLGLITGGCIDAIGIEERSRVAKSKRAIARCLDAADLVVVRDAPSRDEVLKCGVTREVIVGADSAILMQAANVDEVTMTPGVRALMDTHSPKIGLCISAQGPIQKERELAHFLDEIMEETGAGVLAIPMNPLTDSALMARVAGRLRHRDSFLVLTGEYTPAEIVAVTAGMDVIISSRLHLLILGATVGVPLVGIARGSKVDNFLAPFDLSPSGSVDDCDFDVLKQSVLAIMDPAANFGPRAAGVLSEMKVRLAQAELTLSETLAAMA